MQAVASELGATETAFVLPAEDADRRLRCFSPTGTGTGGDGRGRGSSALYERGEIDDSEWTVATARVDVAVETKQNGWSGRARTGRHHRVDIPYSDVADALGLNAATLKDVGADLPLVTAGVGESWLMVPVNYFEHLSGPTTRRSSVDSLCDGVDAAGVDPFTFDTVVPTRAPVVVPRPSLPSRESGRRAGICNGVGGLRGVRSSLRGAR